MERADRALSVHHRARGRRVHTGVAGTRIQSRDLEAHVPPVPAHGAGIFAGRAFAVAVASRAPRTIVRDVPDTPQVLRDGDVRLRLLVVLDGGPAAGDLARIPRRYRLYGAASNGYPALDLQGANV